MLVELTKTYAEVYPLYIQCGLFWEEAERTFLNRFLEKLRNGSVQKLSRLEIPMLDLYGSRWYVDGKGIPGFHESDEQWEIPGRNIILTAKAGVWCRLSNVGNMALGSLASNPFGDATPEFFAFMETALSSGLEFPVQILRPLEGLHKSEVIRLGSYLPLELTLSCAQPAGDRHCGRCGKCRERIHAFREARVTDPTTYLNPNFR